MTQFSITDSAAKRINFLASTEPNPNCYLRIQVEGGGCSGFQYKMDFDVTKNSDDLEFHNNGAKVLIDNTSLDFIKGSSLDYVETLGYSNFEIKNPQATASCGCGNSFAV
jgi:iron-sulfur cluster insertion protein